MFYVRYTCPFRIINNKHGINDAKTYLISIRAENPQKQSYKFDNYLYEIGGRVSKKREKGTKR